MLRAKSTFPILLLGIIPFLPLNAYAQEYYEINWLDKITFYFTNPILTLQLLWDQPHIDKIYEDFAGYRNAYIDNGRLPATAELQEFANRVNDRIVAERFCEQFTPDKVKNIIRADIPYNRLNTYCDIPRELDNEIRNKLS